jgi:hypothetical protein
MVKYVTLFLEDTYKTSSYIISNLEQGLDAIQNKCGGDNDSEILNPEGNPAFGAAIQDAKLAGLELYAREK